MWFVHRRCGSWERWFTSASFNLLEFESRLIARNESRLISWVSQATPQKYSPGVSWRETGNANYSNLFLFLSLSLSIYNTLTTHPLSTLSSYSIIASASETNHTSILKAFNAVATIKANGEPRAFFTSLLGNKRGHEPLSSNFASPRRIIVMSCVSIAPRSLIRRRLVRGKEK